MHKTYIHSHYERYYSRKNLCKTWEKKLTQLLKKKSQLSDEKKKNKNRIKMKERIPTKYE